METRGKANDGGTPAASRSVPRRTGRRKGFSNKHRVRSHVRRRGSWRREKPWRIAWRLDARSNLRFGPIAHESQTDIFAAIAQPLGLTPDSFLPVRAYSGAGLATVRIAVLFKERGACRVNDAR